MLGGKLFHCHLTSKWYTFRVSFTFYSNRCSKINLPCNQICFKFNR